MTGATPTWLKYLVTSGGLGLIPRAPGTWGSSAGIPLFWGISVVSPNILGRAAILLLLTILSYFFIQKYEDITGQHDDQRIVLDETIAFSWVLLPFPFSIEAVVFSFLWFRCFDVWKPGPIGWIDRHWKGARGTLGDDLVAALFSIFFTKLSLLVFYEFPIF